MKKLFHKIYNAITLKDLEEEINCLENDIEDLKHSMEAQTVTLENLQKEVAGFFDSES